MSPSPRIDRINPETRIGAPYHQSWIASRSFAATTSKARKLVTLVIVSQGLNQSFEYFTLLIDNAVTDPPPAIIRKN